MAQTAHDKVVGEKPKWNTPDVLDGQVRAIAKVGDTIVLGGNFTQVSPRGSDEVHSRRNILAFDASEGTISTTFVPQIDGTVHALVPAPGGEAVYVGGSFKNVNGTRSKSLALLDISTGEQVPSFDIPPISARVFDLGLSGGLLYIGGAFNRMGGGLHRGLATVEAETGALDQFMDVQFTGTHRGNYDRVENFAISPDGSRLVAIGNFTEADGSSRHQIAMLDLTGSSAEVAANWRTTRYSAPCSDSFSTYMRDVDFAPDGEYFVVVTTGAGHPGTLCDTAARWETADTGEDVQPTWASATGGDTLLSVAVTGTAVYVGGHQRWQNNPEGVDEPGPGAVPRPGIAALDPVNGLPLSWNAMREPRGGGAAALLATENGLWVGSDTEFIGWHRYRRERIAFLPLAGGERPVQPEVAELPANVYLAGKGDADALAYRSYDGSQAGEDHSLPAGAWQRQRGSVLINDTLWYGWSNGLLYKRSFDGEQFGEYTAVDPYSSDHRDGQRPDFYNEIDSITGMFYWHGRLYYTVQGADALYYRHFTPDSGVVGAERFTAAEGAEWADVAGMFRSGDELYFSSWSDGKLRRVGFSGGEPTGEPAVVSGPDIDGKNWQAHGMFLHPGS